ncbi:hypothetical protein Lser_V15G02783 [Lactuca serriola]
MVVGKGCKFVGCGTTVPILEVSNDDLSKIVGTNDEWIYVRTGIRNRRVLTDLEEIVVNIKDVENDKLKKIWKY